MNDSRFSLQPFAANNSLRDFQITGSVTRRDRIFAIRYLLLGSLAEVMIPALADNPVRKNELWQETCCEFFLAVKDSPSYWEFNLSPAGHWNVYRFDAYRQGMQAEMAFTSLPFTVESQSDALSLSLEFDLDKIVEADQPIEVAISTVIKLRNAEVIYCALIHPGSQADFHRRDSFIIN